MADFRTLKKHEVFLTLKRDLVMAIQTTYIAKEWVDNAHKQMKEKEGRCIAAVEAFTLAEYRIKDLNIKLAEANIDKKSVETALEGAKRAENQSLNQVGVDASSTLRRAENAFYPPALRVAGPSSSLAKAIPKAPKPSKDASASALPALTIPCKEADQAGAVEKDKEPAKEIAPKPTKLPPAPKDSSKEKGAS
nr:uncharacterized protein LOC112030182 [Quercus suber]